MAWTRAAQDDDQVRMSRRPSRIASGLSLIFNLSLRAPRSFVQVAACRRDMARPPLDPLRVPLTELEDESDGRDVQCGLCPGRGVG